MWRGLQRRPWLERSIEAKLHPEMTDQDPTLKDLWRLVVSLDRRMTDGFDSVERRFAALDERISAMDAHLSAFEASIGASLDALKESI